MASGTTSLTEDGVKVKQVQELKLQGEGVYTGQVHEDTLVPHGSGRMEYFVLDATSSAEGPTTEFDDDLQSYEGNWYWGAWHGPMGILQFTNGDSYVGDFYQNQRHGQGLYMWADGRTYEGAFQHNLRHGRGCFTFGDGAVYTGEFHKGDRHGHGRYAFPNGNYYNGGWKDGKYNGYGVFKWNDGREYKGEWKDSQCHGRGIQTDAFGEIVHDGMWSNHKPVIPESVNRAEETSPPLEISIPNPGSANEHANNRHDHSNQNHDSSRQGRWREPSGRAAVSMHNLSSNQDFTTAQPSPHNRVPSGNGPSSDTLALDELSAYQPEVPVCDPSRSSINNWEHPRMRPPTAASLRWRDPDGAASQSMHNLYGDYTLNSQQRQQQQQQQNRRHHQLLQEHQQKNQLPPVLPRRPSPPSSGSTQWHRSSGGSTSLQSTASLTRSNSGNTLGHSSSEGGPTSRPPNHGKSDFSHVALLRSTSDRGVHPRSSLSRGSNTQSATCLANPRPPQSRSLSYQSNRNQRHSDPFLHGQQRRVGNYPGSNGPPAERWSVSGSLYSRNEEFQLAPPPGTLPTQDSSSSPQEESALPAGWEGLPEISALIEGQRKALERYNSLRDLNKDNDEVDT